MHCVKHFEMSRFVMSFNIHHQILIHKMCMNVMRIFMDKEMWLKFRRQISVLQALLVTWESNHTRIVKCIRPPILFVLAIMSAKLSAPKCECWSLPATSKQ